MSRTATFQTSLETGCLRWDELSPFPAPDSDDEARGDEVVAEFLAFADDVLDPDELDRTGELPDGLITGLRERGFLSLRNERGLGGLELTAYNTFRVIEAAASRSVAMGQLLAVQNGVGAGPMLPAIPPGPLLDHLRARVAQGALSGFGDTGPTGQNNAKPDLVATLSEDGTEYLLRGGKLFTGNGSVAEVVGVSVTIAEPDRRRRVGACYVESSAPGYRVESVVDFMGSRGLPNAALRFDDVRVPREHMLVEGDGAKLPALIGAIALEARAIFTAGPALAAARNCLEWSRDFVLRRRIDGRDLAEYDKIQRIVAATLADVFAIDSVMRFALVGSVPGHKWLERFAAKNICTLTAWRAVDRTMSLLGGEGYESLPSKRRRGAPPLPVERFFRDARGLRITGNVDFQNDNQLAQRILSRHFAEPSLASAAGSRLPAADGLSPANTAHLNAVAADVAEFARTCARLARQYRPAELFAREQEMIVLGRVACELLAATAVLVRASGPEPADSQWQDLADIHCTAARGRLAGLWRELDLAAGDGPDYAKTSRTWLAAQRRDR